MDGQRFMDLLVGNPVLSGITVMLSYLWISYILRPRKHLVTPSKLGHFPTVGSSLPILSTIYSFKFFTNAQLILNTGIRKWPGRIFKVPTPYGYWVVVTAPSDIEDMRKAPDHILSASAPIDEIMQVPYTLGSEVIVNPYHVPVIRSQLNRALPKLMPVIHSEIEDAFKNYIPAKDDWISIKAFHTSMKMITCLMNRILVGPPLCRDPEWIKINTAFTKDAFTVAFVLGRFPDILRPLVNYLITPIDRLRRAGVKNLGPIVAARRKEREEGGGDPETQLNFLSWLMDDAQGEEKQVTYLLRRLFALNFAAVHTTSMAFTHALYYLALYPAYWSALREEVENATNKDGWTKAAVDQMYKVDSFIKESQRLHPLATVLVSRKTLEEFTFSNGTKVPPGVFIVVSSITHHDPEVFEDPSKFDGLRFIKMKERAIKEGHPDKKFDMVTASPHSLVFGHGRSACPGRFLAASVIKMMFAYVVVTYDVKLADGVRPPDSFVMHSRVPSQTAEVLFRRRDAV